MLRLIIAGHCAGQVCSAMPERDTDAFAASADLRPYYGSGRMLLRFPQAEKDPNSPPVSGAILDASPVPGGGT